MTNNLVPSSGFSITPATASLVDEWLAYERGNGSTAGTVQTYSRHLLRFLDWMVAEGLAGGLPRPSDIQDFKLDLAEDYAPQTVNLALSAVRSFFRYLVNTDLIPVNPADQVKGIKQGNSRTHKRGALTDAEVLAVLAACDPSQAAGARDLAILTLMAYCALRTIEVHRADVGNLKTRGNRMILEVWGKGRREADEVVVIPRDQEQVFRAWIRFRSRLDPFKPASPLFISLSNRSAGTRLATRSIRDLVSHYFEVAGVVGADKTTPALRHTAITAAIRSGADPMQVQKMARHGSFDTTLGYIHEVSRLEAPAEDLIDYDR